jgi:hypothetical protein
LGRETGVDVDAGEGWAVMSKRFLRWVGTWIEENIPPGANPDIESHEVKAKRLTEKLFAEALVAGFTTFETDEERDRIPPLVQTAVADSTDFDIDAYRLKSELANENEDGD